ncbi:MAG: helical backbone metal receptor [Polyangiales bacterium]
MLRTYDDRQRAIAFARPPTRVVSLVPSDTYTVARLAGVERLVGRTDYCTEPRGEIEHIATVGGTKDAKVDAIRALKPDLVIANQEENTKSTLEALALERIPVFVVFPKRVEDGVALVARFARILGVETTDRARDMVRACFHALESCGDRRTSEPPLRVFCPIWADPLMTIHGDTYISDALDLAGAHNVFADRARRYPLAADLGRSPPTAPSAIQAQGRDTRYPRITDAELIARAPDAILLPDEPHPFSDTDAARFRALPLPACKPHRQREHRVVHITGKDVCWYGAWSAQGIPRLAEIVDGLR